VIALDLAEVARITGGALVDGADPHTTVVGSVVVDSRQVEAGSLFVCIRGEQVDGHSYARQAVAGGAAAALVTSRVEVPAVLVDDAQAALAALATAVLDRTSCQVVGVTGSSGKTSTKDLLAAMFAAVGPTVAPENSFNNEYGLPLTALRVTADTRTLVLEYSARGVGHIRYLCGIARPDVAVVLNVGEAHLGEFGSRAAIAMAKGELVEALPPDGVAVLNADDPLVAAMAGRTAARTLTFGAEGRADVRISDVRVDELDRPAFTVVTPDGRRDVRLALHGRHQALNAAAAIAAGSAAGLPVDVAVHALEQVTAISPHRMQLRPRQDGLIVIDDAYNANPDSTRAALAALARMRGTGRARTWAVLGPMRELGAESDSLHAAVGVAAAELGVDELVVVGEDAAAIADGARGTPGWTGTLQRVADAAAASDLLRERAASGDIVLVKASNSERLWRVADALLTDVRATA
jgi:UDP-N-acetylmuramoyl-tripeptide--D-alanyl-D-alanine ligase